MLFRLFYSFRVLRQITSDTTAVSSSEIQKACQTPTAPSAWLSRNDAGIMITTKRHSEMTSDCVPLPRPSSAPAEMTDTDYTIKPMLIRRSAVSPAAMVASDEVNSPISVPGTSRQMSVPAAMITPLIARATR